MRIGVLALQGGFELHAEKLRQLGANVLLIRKQSELDAIDGLIIPGGESTTLLRLCSFEFRKSLTDKIATGLPILATCAGLILLAKKVSNPTQESLGALNIEVERNSYGRQVDSFITRDLELASSKNSLSINYQLKDNLSKIEAIFIRAPRIREVGEGVEILLTNQKDPVLIKQKKILGATFHPELGQGRSPIHELFLTEVK